MIALFNIHHHIETIKEKILIMKTVKIYSQHFYVLYSSVNYCYHVIYHIPSAYLSYNWKLYLLIIFLQFPLSAAPASAIHKFDHFFYEFIFYFYYFLFPSPTLCLLAIINLFSIAVCLFLFHFVYSFILLLLLFF